MSRPRSYTVAAILMVLYCLISLLDTVPTLAKGAPAPTADAPPFFLTLATFALAILGIVGAYGVWTMQKWGVMLTIAVAALGIVASLPSVLFAELTGRVLGGVGIVWSVAIIVLLLRRAPVRVMASGA